MGGSLPQMRVACKQEGLHVNDSLVLRRFCQFCRICLRAVPDEPTLFRLASLIQPAAPRTLLDHVAELARMPKATRGRRIRTDGKVVATNIHHPRDSTLVGDAVRVLSRTLKRAAKVLPDPPSLTPLGRG